MHVQLERKAQSVSQLRVGGCIIIASRSQRVSLIVIPFCGSVESTHTRESQTTTSLPKVTFQQ